MSLNQTLAVKPSAVALMALMAATRFHHFGTPFALPDASLAVFFFAGLWLGGRYLFALLLAEAVLIDYLAITKLGVSDFCVSKAYGFLVFSYGAMWLGGKWCRQFTGLSIATSAQRLMALVAATSIAFLFSNGSFYWLSGRYPNGSFAQYIERVAMYYPPYLTSTLIYGVVIFGLVTVVKSLLAAKATREAL
ncbi:hypothetical protein U737_22985 [Methylomonas sp. LW13]|uniref:hypothetical protein n=1 Tax=unclassified Methylomonas TaxID=2608980 RepID=UPI00051AF78C|nr:MULTISPECIES: hypothetical protein [unclassified Methylomonas]PKD40129.1 hypothetical protein CWO84_11050 [Methylomonas sp. Kb3]QBC29545.1 hypothetical protein U737_22985 [Methylomonas sp. LW13]